MFIVLFFNLHLIFSLLSFIPVLFENENERKLFPTPEKYAIEKLRSLVGDVLIKDVENTDDYLIRWLRVNEMNVKDAAIMLRENMRWRKHNNIDSIMNETIFEFNPKPYVIDGYDKEGSPIVIFRLTVIDIRKLVTQGKKDEMKRYFFQLLENGMNAVIKSPKRPDGKNITRMIGISDSQGYNLKQHYCLECILIYKEMAIELDKYYPEALKQMVVINVPRIGNQFVEIIRPLLSPTTRKAIKLFGSDRKEWSTYLLNIISTDQLPYRFGGTKSLNSI